MRRGRPCCRHATDGHVRLFDWSARQHTVVRTLPLEKILLLHLRGVAAACCPKGSWAFIVFGKCRISVPRSDRAMMKRPKESGRNWRFFSAIDKSHEALILLWTAPFPVRWQAVQHHCTQGLAIQSLRNRGWIAAALSCLRMTRMTERLKDLQPLPMNLGILRKSMQCRLDVILI